MRSWPLLLPSSFFFFFLRLLFLTHFGESPQAENLFPPIFWHNQKIYAPKKLGVIFICLGKKLIFDRFFAFLRPAFGHGCLGHPQSLEYYDTCWFAKIRKFQKIWALFLCVISARPAFGRGAWTNPQSLEYFSMIIIITIFLAYNLIKKCTNLTFGIRVQIEYI